MPIAPGGGLGSKHKDDIDGDVYESQAQFISGNLQQASEFIREAWRVINNLYAHLTIFLGALFLSYYTINADWLKVPLVSSRRCEDPIPCSLELFKKYAIVDGISGIICVAGLLGCFATALMLDQMARHTRRFLSWAAIVEAFAVFRLAGVETRTPMFWNVMRLSESRGYHQPINLILIGRILALICAIPWSIALYHTVGRAIDYEYLERSSNAILPHFFSVDQAWWALLGSCILVFWWGYRKYRLRRELTWRVEERIYSAQLLRELNLQAQFDVWFNQSSVELNSRRQLVNGTENDNKADAVVEYLRSPEVMIYLLGGERTVSKRLPTA
jgi:hypothetical protein